MKVIIALGSNLGDREENLNRAEAELSEVIRIDAISTFIETDPVGGPEQPDYLNAVLIGDCNRQPEELLQLLLQIESRLGRVRDVKWGPRTLDLDLIVAGDLFIDSEELQIPHPRAHERAFVLAPWLEIDPDGYIPGKGRIADLLAGLNSD
ncbi:MAG: 2-amino-4-hydroxy-6-hydroxymethyldihydropteridine diphosphokinase [Actinomycetes bacterium]